jgi:hypothetical protein
MDRIAIGALVHPPVEAEGAAEAAEAEKSAEAEGAAEALAELRAFVARSGEDHARAHAAARAAYHAGLGGGEGGEGPRATVRVVVGAGSAAVTVAGAATVVVPTPARGGGGGAFLGFDAVVDAVARAVGVGRAELTAVMRFKGIARARRATNLLVKVGAVGKGLANNPEHRKRITLELRPRRRCDACHAPTDEVWRREFAASGLFVAVCPSAKCRAERVTILGAPRAIRKIPNLKRVVFVQ